MKGQLKAAFEYQYTWWKFDKRFEVEPIRFLCKHDVFVILETEHGMFKVLSRYGIVYVNDYEDL